MIYFYFILLIIAVSAGKHEPECGENESWNDCECNELDSSGEPQCPIVCIRQCTCNPGYIKGPGGKCILEEDCPPEYKCSGKHEFWNECGSDCEDQCHEPKNRKVCDDVCVPKCSCKSGYVRGPNGHCVAKEDCPPKHKCHGRHEFWNECGSDCEEKCHKSENTESCAKVCVPKCSCKSGYVRGPDGHCVAKEDCPPKHKCHGRHEFWNECGSDCEEKCHKSENTKGCAKVCVPKCSCKSGYVRGPDGHCVAEEDCPPKHKCHGQHEFWNECGSDCEEKCHKSENTESCAKVCVPKCSCKSGYVRGPDGHCVAKEDCPPKHKCHGRHEFWNECGSDCEEQCHKSENTKGCAKICVPKCSCEPGYVRGPNGHCVAKEDCPPRHKCHGRHEFWNECGSDCEEKCHKSENTESCAKVCVPKCSCKSGYVRGPDGHCVAKEDCPPKHKCHGRHEFWNECGSDCEEQCHKSENTKGCAKICVPKCSCEPGYVRGPNGHCVAKEDCPPRHKCHGQHEFWNECGFDCEEQCHNSAKSQVCRAGCVPKCSCKSGYVRGPDGHCVAKEDCPPKPKCHGRHEFWNECGSDCEERCHKFKDHRVCTDVCIPKCSCEPGYVRGPGGNCIAKKDCPSKHVCSDPNAVWSDCASACHQHSCNESSEPKSCAAVCLRQCVCKPGYVTGPHGNCILKKDCPPKHKCPGRNEFWNECGSDCEERCYKSKNHRVCTDVCVPKCTCKPGHVRGPGGNCILKEDCPSKHVCSDPNAVWSDCASACNQHSCNESSKPKFCPAICLQQCVCKPGYVTGPHGNCILKEDCPPIHKCPGRNEFWNECGSDCEERCSKSKDHRVCTDVCVPKCTCKPGHVRGPGGNCILKEDCPSKHVCSDPNAVWSDCASACNQHSCNESSEPKFCPANCLRQCVCKPGYVTGPHGNCILKEDCPPIHKCSGRNEFWNECGSDCEERCSKSKDYRVCTDVCVPKCTCKPGHVRGPGGRCILKENCPRKHICSDPNAVWSDCASSCNQHSCNESSEPKFCPAYCLRKCVCKPGYVTGPHGNCILKEDCPPIHKCPGRNEFWNECGSDCEERCHKSKDYRVCTDVCVPKCTCQPGYVRGPGGKCIAKQDCPKTCPGKNQFWNECGNGCEPRCDKSHLHKACTAVCVKKCSCKKGYLIADNGDCVKEEDCYTTCTDD